MRNKKTRISIVIPVHNEAGNLNWHHEMISQHIAKLNHEWEIIYVDDGSQDESFTIIEQISKSDQRVQYLKFSRNFGKEAATTAGLRKSSGSAVILMDADGQHPIEKIDSFIKEWQAGNQVVIGLRDSNKNAGVVKNIGSAIFNNILAAISGTESVKGSTDFRLLDRKVVDEFNLLTEHNRITRGLVDWLGFKRSFVRFAAPERHSGKASYSFKKLVGLAIHAFVSHSTKPLQFTGYIGFLVVILSALTGLFLIVEVLLLGDPMNLNITGSAMLGVFLSLLIGLVLICQWLLALYIESIHTEAQNRPLYIVDTESESN